MRCDSLIETNHYLSLLDNRRCKSLTSIKEIDLIDRSWHINLEDVTKSYSLDELQIGLEKIIGEGAVFVIARLKNGLS